MEEVLNALRSAQGEDELFAHLDRIDNELLAKLENEEPAPAETETQEEPKAQPAAEPETADIEEAVEEADEVLKILESESEPEQVQTPSEPPRSAAEIIESDPVLRQLASMTEEERVTWATQHGAAGIAKLLQLQKLETMMMIEQAKIEAQKPSLDAMLQSWAAKNAELLQDPMLKEIAKGLEFKFLAERGKTSYEELNVMEMREMLNYIESTIKSIKQKIEGGQEAEKATPSQAEKVRSGVGVADIAGGAPPQQSELEILERISSDPLKLEEAISKLPPSKLDDLLAQLQ